MKYAIISDIHGNRAALDEVFNDIVNETCGVIFCLGDIVGYGPFPNECIRKIKTKSTYSILGNHDAAAIGKTDISYFNEYAQHAINWTFKQLDRDNRSYLEQLAVSIIYDDFLFIHASPYQPLEWGYILSLTEAAYNFRCYDQQLCFIGHSHVPVIYAIDLAKHVRLIEAKKIQLELGKRYIFNVGSVGQPRDGDPRACYGIFDSEEQVFCLKRVKYDIKATQDAMVEAKLPDFLINRLAMGY